MHITQKPKSKIKSVAAVGLASTLLLLTPGVALAHGFNDRDHDGRYDHESQDKKTCQQWQNAINQRVSATKAELTTRLNTDNDLFNKMQTFVTNHNLTVTDYDALKADTTSAQSKAIAAVANVKTVNLNCDQKDEAQKTKHDFDMSFQTNIKAAKDALTAYETSLDKLELAIFSS